MSYSLKSGFGPDDECKWKVSQMFGFGDLSGNFKYLKKHLNAFNSDILVLDDAAMDFGDNNNKEVWPSFIQDPRGKDKKIPKLIIYKMSGHTAKGDLWKKVLTELGEKKMAHTVFFHLMGEPLLHPDIFEAVKLANDFDLSVSLYTNGSLLDEENSDRLLNVLKRGRIVVSLQNTRPDLFKERSGNFLSWEKYLKRIKSFMKKAQQKEVPVQIHLMSDVRSMGWNIFKILEEQKRFQSIYDAWNNSDRRQKINVLDPEGIYSLGKNSSLFIKYSGTWDNSHIEDIVEVKPSNTGRCELMTDTFAVLADGRTTYCCCDFEGALDLGNAEDNSLEDIYYGEKAVRIREAASMGNMIEQKCKICRGKLIYKKSKKPVKKGNLLSEYYLFIGHLRRYGAKSTFHKVLENLRRRLS